MKGVIFSGKSSSALTLAIKECQLRASAPGNPKESRMMEPQDANYFCCHIERDTWKKIACFSFLHWKAQLENSWLLRKLRERAAEHSS